MAAADNTRQLLIDIAGPLFADKGIEATSVRDVTDRAGANVSAIHYHFRGMNGLYREAMRQAATACANRAVFPDWPSGTPPTNKLRDFIETFLRRVANDCEPAWHPQLLQRELAHPTEAVAEFTQDFVQPTVAVLHGILTELLPADMTQRKLQLCAMSVIGQILHYRFARPVIRQLLGEKEFQAMTVEVLREHIHEFSIAAIRSIASRHRRESA